MSTNICTHRCMCVSVQNKDFHVEYKGVYVGIMYYCACLWVCGVVVLYTDLCACVPVCIYPCLHAFV